MKLKILLMISLLIICTAFVNAEPFHSDENMEMGDNSVYNASEVNTTRIFLNGTNILDINTWNSSQEIIDVINNSNVKVANSSYSDDSALLEAHNGSYYLDNTDTWNSSSDIVKVVNTLGYYNSSKINDTVFEDQSGSLGLVYSWLATAVNYLIDSISWGGDLSGNGTSPSVSDNSHLHTVANISDYVGNTSSEIIDVINNSNVKVANSSYSDNSALLLGQNGSFYLDNTDNQKGTNDFYLHNDSLIITFNESQLNNTILAVTASTTYNATSVATIEGTLTDGDLGSLQSLDNDWYNVSEDSGGAPLLIEINFTGVVNFGDILLRSQYEGGSGHEIEIQLWNNVTSVWETHNGDITDQSSMNELVINILDPSNHISGGLVRLRFDHAQSGVGSHNFFLDYVALQDGFTSLTSSDHDSLLGRDSTSNHPWALDKAGNRALTDNWYADKGIYSNNWTNTTILESQVSDLNHTTEVDPFWLLNFTNMQSDCPSGNYSYGILPNGSFKCRSDLTGAPGSDTQKKADGDYLYNDSTTIYFNTTKNNESITYISDALGYYNKSKINDTVFEDQSGSLGLVYSWLATAVNYLIGLNPESYVGNNSEVVFTEVNITTELTMSNNSIVNINNLTFGSNPQNHYIYDNSTCIVIKGSTSEIQIC